MTFCSTLKISESTAKFSNFLKWFTDNRNIRAISWSTAKHFTFSSSLQILTPATHKFQSVLGRFLIFLRIVLKIAYCKIYVLLEHSFPMFFLKYLSDDFWRNFLKLSETKKEPARLIQKSSFALNYLYCIELLDLFCIFWCFCFAFILALQARPSPRKRDCCRFLFALTYSL